MYEYGKGDKRRAEQWIVSFDSDPERHLFPVKHASKILKTVGVLQPIKPYLTGSKLEKLGRKIVPLDVGVRVAVIGLSKINSL